MYTRTAMYIVNIKKSVYRGFFNYDRELKAIFCFIPFAQSDNFLYKSIVNYTFIPETFGNLKKVPLRSTWPRDKISFLKGKKITIKNFEKI